MSRGLVVTVLIVTAFLIYYAIMSIMAPGKKFKELENEIRSGLTTTSQIDERFINDSLYIGLLREKAFLQSRILMAGTDSISLTLNLADSLAQLEIAGVVVKTTDIEGIRMSKMLHQGNDFIITSLLSSPLNITGDRATIKKEPLMVKMAPKDTSEYKPDIMPDTSAYEAVSYILETDKGIRIYVTQSEKAKKGYGKELAWFDLKYRLGNSWEALKSAAQLKVPEYHPFIKIKLPRTDAKVIYRAIPTKGQITVYI
ncbi:MAG: hypothetical protein HPY62_01000 [Bacteroidales bacterium]|nr:hypothetical protein [Bacteroidales bacterium]